MANKQLMLPANRAFNSNGLAISGAQAKLYATGTSTPATFYADAGLTTPIGSTITADGAGRFPTAYQNESTPFRFQTLDASGSVLDDIDPFYFGFVQGATGPAGPAGDVSHVADRVALAAVAGQVGGAVRHLVEGDREGVFIWAEGNHAASVSADPNQGIFVAPASDPTGGSGVWVREFSGKVNIMWFGAVADWNGTTGTDTSAAFVAALNYINTSAASGLYAAGNLGLYIPKGKYYLGTTTLDIRTSITIEGDSIGEAGGEATFLKWAAGTTGIRVQAGNTTGATSSQSQDATKSGAGTIIKGLHLEGGYTTTEGEFYGIHLRARASIRDCYITLFQGDGIYIVATAGGSPEGNVNNFEITKCLVTGCRNGLYLSGADVNAGSIIALDSMNNRSWGVSDNSFLGNTYTACHTSGNGSGPYQTTNNNAANVFIGCYSESGQPASAFVYQTVILGGQHAAGISGTGAYIRNALGITTFDSIGASSASIDNLQVNVGGIYEGGSAVTLYSGFNNGNYLRGGSTLNFNGLTKVGLIAHNDAVGSQDMYLKSATLNWMCGVDSGIYFSVSNTGVNSFNGYKVNGTSIIGTTGTLQAAGFPALTGDVTTTAGSLATTISANAVTYSKLQQVGPLSIVGNATGSTTNAQNITLAADHSFSGTTIQLGAFTGDITKTAGSLATTVNGAPTATTGLLTTSSSGVGYRTGAGGTVTQLTSRTTGVTINKPCGAIALVSAAGSATWATFTVTNSTVAATDTVEVVQKSGANLYSLLVTAVAAGSFNVSVSAVSGTATEAPVLNFTVTKGVTA